MFEIAHTKELRDTFARIHQEMSGANPSGPQFPFKEQYEMYKSCAVPNRALPDEIDVEKTEDNLLELIHYLNENGVGVTKIFGPARTFSRQTQGVSMRLRLDERRRSSDSLFQAPALV